MKHHEPGPDLIRVIGLLFVNCLHSFLYNGFYYEEQTGLVMWGANTMRWIFFGANGIFMMLTGYLKTNKPWNKRYYRGLLPVLVGYTLTCVISYPIRHFVLGEKLTLIQWLVNYITFSNYSWYIEMYIGLIFISPLLNLALDALGDGRRQLMAVVTLFVMTALPSITSLQLIPQWWTGMYPATYYLIGAWIKRNQPKIKPGIALIGLLLSSGLMGLLTLISTDGTSGDGFGQGYGGFYITVSVTFLFLALYRIHIGPRFARFLAWVSGGVFEGYILSRLFDVWIYGKVPFWHDPRQYPLILLCVTVPVFLISLFSGKLVHSISGRICGPRNARQKI